MKQLQKLILPGIFLIVAFTIYLAYFAPKDSLGSFDNFDTNSNINQPIKVAIINERGVNRDTTSGILIFYARDKNGKEVVVNAPMNIPVNILDNETVILRGHLHPDHFHATEIEAD